MSRTRSPGAAQTARQARLLTHQFTAKLTGRQRGPDPEVRRDSYDVDDPKAKPWAPIGDGSVAQGMLHLEALLQAAEELRHQHWKEMPAAELREARAKRAAITAELARVEAGEAAPAGWPATLRLELAALDALIERGDGRLRRIDVGVLRALLRHLDFRTGKLFPTLDRIAEAAGVHRNAAIAALRRLKAHGFLTWVRRSIRVAGKGHFGQQRAQTSNGYGFDWRRKMASATWQRFTQILGAKLRRLGKVPAALRPSPATAPRVPADPGLRAVLASFSAAVDNAST